jgi:hypothetical protein
LNRAKEDRAEQLRAEILDLASAAVATHRATLTSPEVPPVVRLKACLTIREATNAMRAGAIEHRIARVH